MKKSLSKIITLLIVSVLLIVSFSSCIKVEEKESTSTSSTEGKSETTKAVKMETFKVWTGSGHTKELITKMVQEYNETIGKEKGIQIEYTVYGSDYQNVLEISLASGQAAEIVAIPGGKFVATVKKNVLMPIAELPGGKEFLKKYEGYLKPNIHTVNGIAYSVPFNVNTQGMVYNKDLFKKAGIVDAKGEAKPPVTWDEVVEYAKKLTNTQEKTYGIILPFKWVDYVEWEILHPFIASIGHSYFDHKTGRFDFEAFKPAAEWLMKIKADKSYFPGPEALDNDTARAQFSEGRIGMKLAASWDVGVYNDQFPAKIDWGVAPIPVLDLNNRYKQYMSGPGFFEITNSAKDKNLEKVMEIYKWFNSDEFLAVMYEESKFIPYKSEIISMAKKQPDKKGWKEFSSMTEISYLFPQIPNVTIEGLDFKQTFMKMWMGEISVDEALTDLDKRYNAALDKMVSEGKINIDEYKFNDFDIRLK